MVRSPVFVQLQREKWRTHPCPYCGAKGVADWLCILTTYSLHCHACGQVVEAFELYETSARKVYTENHYIAEPDDGERGKPVMRRVE